MLISLPDKLLSKIMQRISAQITIFTLLLKRTNEYSNYCCVFRLKMKKNRPTPNIEFPGFYLPEMSPISIPFGVVFINPILGYFLRR